MANLNELTRTNLSREGALWVVTIDCPQAQNALGPTANDELERIFDTFAADASARVAILTGTGPAFCSGRDYDEERGGVLPASGFGGLTRRFDLPKPIIAAVNGDALDEGFELVLACDLVIANEDARFAMQQGLWGRAPVEGGVHRLVRQVPLKKAMAALLTGTPLSAAEGVLLGFVNDITGFDQVPALARQWAERILRLSPQSVLAIKESAMLGLDKASSSEACAAAYPELGKLLQSKDYDGGIDRMLLARKER
jgi:enoyl-CoA hydratase/carnithine racemase